MKLVDPSFRLCEEILDVSLHFLQSSDQVDAEKIYKTINKTSAYVKNAVEYLIQIKIITKSENKFSLNRDSSHKKEDLIPASLIKNGILNFQPFKEYSKLVNDGKSVKNALKLIIATHDIKNNIEKVQEIFEKELDYLEKNIQVTSSTNNRINSIPKENNFFWIDENGHLMYDEEADTKQISNALEKDRFKNPSFIDNIRVDSLKKISSTNFDLSKLIRLIEELNDAYRVGNYFSVGILTRAILDHIPPIFNKKSFAEVANNHGSKSFKDVMFNLEHFSRKIADGILHSHIKRKESLPTKTTIECRNAMDILIGEIINELT